MKRKSLLLLPILVAVVLEILPSGAVCIFASAPGETIRKTYSYFDLTPFGYANFAPLITAVLTCVILAVCIFVCLKGRGQKVLQTLALVATVISLTPLLYGILFFSWTGAAISLLLLTESILPRYLIKE